MTVAVFKVILVRQEYDCYRYVIEWGHAGNEMQSVCDNITVNCDKSAKITNVLASVTNLSLLRNLH